MTYAKNFLTISIRNALKNKTFSLVNVVGLTLGLTCFTIILLFVESEFSFDRFHHGHENIYRIVKDFVNDDSTKVPDATTPPALTRAVAEVIYKPNCSGCDEEPTDDCN